jgi:hypothetical protein
MFATDWKNLGYLRLRATGRLTAADYDRMEPALEAELARRGGRAPLLLDLRRWRGWTIGGFLRDLRFNLRHRNSFPRIAVVGGRRWHRWVTITGTPLFSGEMRYFGAEREREAAEWVHG